MKKVLLPLLCLPLIFSSCQEDDPSPSSAPSSSSSLCGSASVTFDGTNYTLNNPLMQIPGECMVMSTAEGITSNTSGIAVNFTNMKSNNYEVDWSINLAAQYSIINAGENVTITGNPSDLGFYANFSPSNSSSTNFQQYSSSSLPNGQMNITDIDYTNNTIDGNFSLIVYDIMNPTISKSFSGSFSDIPVNP